MIRRREPIVLWDNVYICRLCLQPLRHDQDGDTHPECEQVEDLDDHQLNNPEGTQ